MRHRRRAPELSMFDTLGLEAAIIRQQMGDLRQKVANASLGPVMDDLMTELVDKIKLLQIGLDRCEIEQTKRQKKGL